MVAVLEQTVMETPRVFLSHTTRDERDRDLAHRLATGLEARGARVWIAPDSIPPGDRWEERVVHGVMDGCSHFLVILSAAAAGAEWVVREIALARARAERDPSFRILPLRVGRELPEFDGREMLDALQTLPYEADFEAQLEAVAAALGLKPAVPEALRGFVDEKTRDFVGRDYVYDAIAAFVRSQRNGYFVVEGDPGIGKTAILARYVQRHGSIAHFNSRALGITAAAQFIESAAAQLITRFGLPYPSLPPTATRDGSFLMAALLQAASGLEPGHPLLIVVDALDEADPGADGGNVLYLPPTLPDGVFFLVSRRQTPVPLVVSVPLEVLDLNAFAAEGRRDVAAFVHARLASSPSLRAWIDARGLTSTEFADAIAEKSGGNFMYVRYVVPEIEQDRYADLSIETLPLGLEAYYEDHWRRMGMTARPLPRLKIRVIYVLSVARAPISLRLITRFARDESHAMDELAVQEVLDEWNAFLHEQRLEGETRYSIYHASFRDFLHRREIVRQAGVTIQGIHELFANRLWGDLFGGDGPS